jgi:hypothetical protein
MKAAKVVVEYGNICRLGTLWPGELKKPRAKYYGVYHEKYDIWPPLVPSEKNEVQDLEQKE